MPAHDDLATLRRLLDQERAAHVGRDASLLVSLFADDFINVGAGRVTRPTRAESLAGFQAYFDQSEFLAWDDVEPPLIRISSDGSMAYVVVRKRVHLISSGPDGSREARETTFAWMEAWERLGDAWLLHAVASTNEPD
jgi:ketosteroid isomerase-like protein